MIILVKYKNYTLFLIVIIYCLNFSYLLLSSDQPLDHENCCRDVSKIFGKVHF